MESQKIFDPAFYPIHHALNEGGEMLKRFDELRRPPTREEFEKNMKSGKQIIAFNGHSGTGKSTLAAKLKSFLTIDIDYNIKVRLAEATKTVIESFVRENIKDGDQADIILKAYNKGEEKDAAICLIESSSLPERRKVQLKKSIAARDSEGESHVGFNLELSDVTLAFETDRKYAKLWDSEEINQLVATSSLDPGFNYLDGHVVPAGLNKRKNLLISRPGSNMTHSIDVVMAQMNMKILNILLSHGGNKERMKMSADQAIWKPIADLVHPYTGEKLSTETSFEVVREGTLKPICHVQWDSDSYYEVPDDDPRSAEEALMDTVRPELPTQKEVSRVITFGWKPEDLAA